MNIILSLLGGIGIFLYGMHLLSKGMERVAVSKMKQYIASFTSNRYKGFLIGIIATFFMQSSTATSIIVIGLVGSSVIGLLQAFGVILGSSVGTTLTVQLLAFNITEYSTIFIFLGAVLIIFLKKKRKAKSFGQAFMGFGFIFFGIGTMSDAFEPLSNNTDFLSFFSSLQEQPILLLVISLLLTVLMHSSATVIVIAMSLATTGALEPSSVIPVILGANLGATFPAIISSLASTAEGRKVAVSYFAFKLTGVALCFPLIYLSDNLVQYLPGETERQIANMHTLFNIFVALLFLPFLGMVAAFIDKMLPKNEKNEFSIDIDDSLLDYPEEALDQMTKEVSKLASIVERDMVRNLPAVLQQDEATRAAVFEKEKYVDEAYKTLQNILLKIGQQDLSETESDQEVKLLYILNDLEHTGDVIKNIGEISAKKEEFGIQLNEDDLKSLLHMNEQISQSFSKSITAFQNNDLEKAKEVLNDHTYFLQLEKDMRFAYFNNRIVRNEVDSTVNDSYLDMISHLLRVHQHAVNISQTLLGIV